MTVAEFNPIMAMLIAGCGTKAAPTAEQSAVYFKLLGDLPAGMVRAGAELALLQHEYPTLPPVGLVRRLAVNLRQPVIPGPEAWRMALAAARKHGTGVCRRVSNGQTVTFDREDAAMAELPANVRRAVRCFGYGVLCEASDAELGIIETQFLKAYASLGEHDDQVAIMPPSVARVAQGVATAFGMDEAPKQPIGALTP